VIARVQNADAQTLESAQTDAASRVAAAYQAVRDAQNKLDDFDIPAQFSGMSAAAATGTAFANLEAAREAFAPYKDTSHKTLKPTNPWRRPIAPQILIDTHQYTGPAKEYKKQLDNAWVSYRRAVLWLELESSLESAQAQLAQAQKDYDSLQDTSLAENTAGARAALANAELRSPFAGTVTNLDLKVGEFAASGEPVVTVADFSSWVVKTTDLTEIDVVNIKEGQPVTLTLDAIPDVTLKGYVLTIGQNYSEKQGDVVYEVSVLLTDKNPAMRWGMTAQLQF
jgi:multidrug resistance efflux pump